MEPIKEALLKARASEPLDAREPAKRTVLPGARRQPAPASAHLPPPPPTLPRVSLDLRHLESTRVVAHEMKDLAHVAFNMLRTRVQKTLRDNGWKSLALISPTAGCGKTMIAANLALSFARQPDCRTILLDLDLTRYGLAGTLGVNSERSIGEYLEGKAELDDCFVQIGENLIVGLNNHSTRNPSELIHGHRLKSMLNSLREVFGYDVLLVDLPPLLASDNAMGFLPNADSSMLVISAEQTTAAEVEECQRQLEEGGNYLGAVLNKSADKTAEYYRY